MRQKYRKPSPNKNDAKIFLSCFKYIYLVYGGYVQEGSYRSWVAYGTKLLKELVHVLQPLNVLIVLLKFGVSGDE